MKTAFAVIKVVLKSALILAMLFVVFRLATFSSLQSVVLALLVWAGYDAYKAVNARAIAENSFPPYRVVVSPKFHKLLLDYKLIKDVEEYKHLYALWQTKKDQALISFTVLELRPIGDWLVYSDIHKCFLSGIDIEEPIEAIVFGDSFDDENAAPVYLRDPTRPDDGMTFRLSPEFYFRQAPGGYELGLNVRDNWWEKVCSENPSYTFAKTKVDKNPITGGARLTIATLPYAAFAVFHTKAGDYEQHKKVWEVMDTELALHGWRREQPNPDDEIRDPWIRLEHEYFGVKCREV